MSRHNSCKITVCWTPFALAIYKFPVAYHIHIRHNFINIAVLILFYFLSSYFFKDVYIIVGAMYIYIHYTIYLYLDRICSRIIKCVPFTFLSSSSLPFFPFVLHSSFFVLRTYSLMAIYWRSRWSPGSRGISITRPCKLSRRCDKTLRRGRRGFSEILTIAVGRSRYREARTASH